MKQLLKFTNQAKKPSQNPGYGYTSRGEDNRLQKSSKERQEFFKTILSQFVEYCNDNASYTVRKDLEEYILGRVDDTIGSYIESTGSISRSSAGSKPTITLESILASLRKLREALLHTKPEEFNKIVYIVSVRLSTSIGHYQSYLPGIKYLLEDCPHLLTVEETKEMANLMVLHFLHFNNEPQFAMKYYFKYLKDEGAYRTWDIIESWIHKDYLNWFRLYNTETHNLRSKLMNFGVPKMVPIMIKSITKSYFTYQYEDFKILLLPNGTSYEDLIGEYLAPWEKNGDTILVRNRK